MSPTEIDVLVAKILLAQAEVNDLAPIMELLSQEARTAMLERQRRLLAEAKQRHAAADR